MHLFRREALERFLLAALLVLLIVAGGVTVAPGRAHAANSCGYAENTNGVTASGQLQALCDLTARGGLAPVTANAGTGLTPTPLAASQDVTTATSSTAIRPAAGRAFCWRLSNTGSATATIALSFDGTNYSPETTGVDGGSLIVMNRGAFNGATLTGGAIVCASSQIAGVYATLQITAVTGTVTVRPYQ